MMLWAGALGLSGEPSAGEALRAALEKDAN